MLVLTLHWVYACAHRTDALDMSLVEKPRGSVKDTHDR
jgi:hypothetical protein